MITRGLDPSRSKGVGEDGLLVTKVVREEAAHGVDVHIGEVERLLLLLGEVLLQRLHLRCTARHPKESLRLKA